MASLSIIVPVLDEADGIVAALTALAPFRTHGAEIVMVDGGSRDRSVELARPLADRVIAAPRGRAVQMNHGAAAAAGDMLLFLHADCRLPPHADDLIRDGLGSGPWQWGRFDVRITGRNPLLRVVAAAMNWRSQLTGIATGDQAMFMTRAAFMTVGGFPELPLMEDVAMSKRLKRVSRPLCLAAGVTASGRRWERHGVIRTIVLMWRLRLAYYLGAEPETLARRYGYVPRDG
jgi:rSAM/selenodomain-associated transferase 2